MRAVAASIAAAVAVAVAGCAVSPPAPGARADAVVAQWGTPTARYAAGDGGERLEYASGPYGRTTWMVDVDAAGRITAARQVLGEASFLELQSTPGLARDDVLKRLGTPGETRHGGRMGGEIWSWRYPTNDCLWFEVVIDRAGRVAGSGYGIDPRCDAPNDARD